MAGFANPSISGKLQNELFWRIPQGKFIPMTTNEMKAEAEGLTIEANGKLR